MSGAEGESDEIPASWLSAGSSTVVPAPDEDDHDEQTRAEPKEVKRAMRGFPSVSAAFKIRFVVLVGAVAVLLSACSTSGSPDPIAREQLTDIVPSFNALLSPPVNADRAASGELLYQQYCASCHKTNLSGDPSWKTPNDDGTYAPPSQDASGHRWHHPDQLLLDIIRDGINGVSSGMPIFQGVLTDEEILSVLEFFRSEWGDEERAFQWQVTWQESQ